MAGSRPSATSRLIVLAVIAQAAGCAAGAYGDNFGAAGSDSANSGSSGSFAAGSDIGGSAGIGAGSSGSTSSGSFGGAAGSGSGSLGGTVGSSGAGYDAGSGGDDGSDAAGVDSSPGTSDAGQAESSGPPYMGLSILYKVEVPAATSAYLGCQLSVKNSGTGSPQISALKARYYFTDEVRLSPQMKINWSHVSTSGPDVDLTVTYAFTPLAPVATGADTYVEFGFSSGHPSLLPGDSAVFSWQMQGPDPSKNLYTQSNDYSFDSSKTTLTNWDHIVLLQNGNVVWGRTP